MTVVELTQILKDLNVMQEDIRSITESLYELNYKTTPSYSITSGVSGGLFSRKVESMALKRLKLKQRLKKVEQKRDMCFEAFNNSGLTDEEKELIRFTCQHKSLKKHADNIGVSRSSVYRTRDKGIEKMCDYINEKYGNIKQ